MSQVTALTAHLSKEPRPFSNKTAITIRRAPTVGESRSAGGRLKSHGHIVPPSATASMPFGVARGLTGRGYRPLLPLNADEPFC